MSTYSPDLRIELITTGDQAGTWGTTTNTNLGTLIEGAIAGYTTVSVIASSQAFTALNGAADEARNAMIRLTTTTGADFAVYAPPNSKQYIIWNNSGYTATIYNSTVIGNTTAAGTGVAIADGDKVVVFTNGTNFYTVKTNNVTGTVAIANGGTGQTTANAAFNALAPSQASANGKYLKSDGTNTSWDAIDLSTSDISGVLPVVNGGTGVTTSTGSGSNVLSNSPTLVTPTLGTPASVTLTNATGLPLTTGVTGTLPVANGGTGQTTANAAFNALAPAQTTANGKYLKSDGTNTAWDQIDISTSDITGTLPVANGGTGVTTSTGTGSVVLSNSPTLVTPALGTPASGTMTNVTGLPLTTGVTGTLPVANGGTGVTTSTGSGSVVLSNSPSLVTPALGTPASGNLANCTFPTLNQNTSGTAAGLSATLAISSGGTGQTSANAAFNALAPAQTTASGKYLKSDGTNTAWDQIDISTADITGTLPVANGGTGVTSSTGTGSVVLSNSPSLVTPALGTPASGNLANCTFPTLNQNTTGTAAGLSATLAVASGGTGKTSWTSGSLPYNNGATSFASSGFYYDGQNGGLNYAADAWSGTWSVMRFGRTTYIAQNGGTTLGSTYVVNGAYYDGTNWIRQYTSTSGAGPTYYRTGAGLHVFSYATGGTAGTSFSSFTDVATIDSAGITLLTGNFVGNLSGNATTATTATSATSATTATSATSSTNATNLVSGGTIASSVTGVTQSQGDNSTKMATTAYVQNMGLGLSQTWTTYNSGGARSVNSSFTWASLTSIYTNSTGKPIGVSVGRFGSNGYATTVWVDAVPVLQATVDQYGGAESMGVAIVQPGSQYAVSVSGGVWCNYWYELR